MAVFSDKDNLPLGVASSKQALNEAMKEEYEQNQKQIEELTKKSEMAEQLIA